MRRYSYQNNKKSRKEKIGFFTAFSVCLVAVGLALWSTYSSIGGFENSNIEESTYVAYYTPTKQVDSPLTGVTVTEEPWEETQQYPTEYVSEDEGVEISSSLENSIPAYTGENEKLQTMLQVSASLDYPIVSSEISKEYSEKAVYNSTMGDYRAHTGVDFKALEGSQVVAMCDGVVEEIYTDSLYGIVARVANGNFSVYYCGIEEDMNISEGQRLSRGDVIGKVGIVPCESKDGAHLHIEVKVGDKTIDPLLIISSNE